MRNKFFKELRGLDLPRESDVGEPITEAELAPLPAAARSYLRFMGVVGRPRDWSFQLSFRGRFRTRPDQGWMKCEAWQYNSRPAVARIFHLRIRFGGLIPVLGRDTYIDGRGRMLIRILDLITVGDGKGEEYDIGELVTFLNDAVLLAPSMLLGPGIRFSAVDERSFDLELTDHGRTVTARVLLDERGAPVDFSTTDRFCADPRDPKRLQRARWTTPIDGWQEVAGRWLPTRGKAVWHTPDGPFEYADFTPVAATLAYNAAPGS